MELTLCIGYNAKGIPQPSQVLLSYIEHVTHGAWEAYLCFHTEVRNTIRQCHIELMPANGGEVVVIVKGKLTMQLGGCMPHEVEKLFTLQEFASQGSPLPQLKNEMSFCFTKKVLEALSEHKNSLQQSKDEVVKLLDLPIEPKAT